MTKKRKRYLEIKAEKEAKDEELRKRGILVRVTYEEKKKKKALPNKKCSLETVEEEIKDRQETAEDASMVYYRMLSQILPKLLRINDPRKSCRIKHKLNTLLLYGILISMYQIGSRRKANRTLSKPIFFDNLRAMFPELDTMPHADTLARILARIKTSQILECMTELLKDLMRSKKFKNFMHKKGYLIAIDGTQKLSRDYEWSTKCLKRNINKEEGKKQYYCYVLEAVLVLENGIVLPIMSEFIENDGNNNSENKQDCERKGFYRLAYKLKKLFRNTKISIVVDGLYACGPVITTCKRYKWDYMITLKQDCMYAVWDEAISLMNLNHENQHICYWGDREQLYSWANEIEYNYKLKSNGKVLAKFKENLNVVICYESWKEFNSRSTGVVEEKNTRYAWLSSKAIDYKNVFYRCTKMGRYRWKIENNILKEKKQGYEYEHCYSYNWDAMKGFHYLMKIGHFLNVLALNSEMFEHKVLDLGIRGFIKYLTCICESLPLDKNEIIKARNKKFMWKLQLIA